MNTSLNDGILEETKKNDMPAARTMIVVVLVLLAVFTIIAGVIHLKVDEQEDTPTRIEQLERTR